MTGLVMGWRQKSQLICHRRQLQERGSAPGPTAEAAGILWKRSVVLRGPFDYLFLLF